MIPNASDATVFNNRLFVPVNRDEIVVSDILDYTRYSEATSRFRINSGTDDKIVRIYPWNQTTLIVFKDQSIYLLSNVFGDLRDLRADVLTREVGLVSRDGVIGVGKDCLLYTSPSPRDS